MVIIGLNGGSTKGFWRVGGRLFGVVTLGYLVYDIYNIIQELREQPGIMTDPYKGITLKDGPLIMSSNVQGWNLTIERSFVQPWSGVNHYKTLRIRLYGQLNGTKYMDVTGEGTAPHTEGDKEMGLNIKFGTRTGYKAYFNATKGFDLIIENEIQGLILDTSMFPPAQADESAVREWVEENLDDFKNKNKTDLRFEDEQPAGAKDLGDAQTGVTDPGVPGENPGEVTDPSTGDDMTPVQYTTTGLGNIMTSPGQPSPGTGIDTTIETPEVKDISTLVSNFLNNAPFMNVINNFQVTATSGSSSLSFTLYGRNISWDFAQYEYYYNMMAAVLLAMAYIWAVQIVFGGRA
jgi:hypothetical protein